MANQNPKTSHLKPVYKNWVHTPTKAVRIPEIFLEEIEQHARIRDRSESGFEIVLNLLQTLTQEELQQLSLAVSSLTDDNKTELLNEPIQLSDNEKEVYIDKFGFVPSHYQLKIIDWILRGNGNGCCNAVAGAGKSTTLKIVAKTLEASGYRPSQIKICVFGKANSLDLISKFGDRWRESISTLNSAGWKIVRQYLQIYPSQKIKLSKNKYKWIAEDLKLVFGRKSRGSRLKAEKILENTADFFKLIDLVRLCDVSVTTSNVLNLIRHFQIEKVYEPDKLTGWIQQCLKIGEQQAINKQCFDFVEQVWLPTHWKLQDESWVKPYKFVLVDECQDLKKAELNLVKLLIGNEGRVLSVGDPSQAVFGFAGADDDSYYTVVKETKAIELPLSICYRCPFSHINLVKKIFPHIPIEAAENAVEGIINQIEPEKIYEHIKNKDMVLGRKTAPLVSLCIKLISQGKKAIVRGKSIGENLSKEVEQIVLNPVYSWKLFIDCLEEYRHIKINQYQGLDNQEELIEAINDKLDAIVTIYDSIPYASNVGDLYQEITKLFSDDNAPITLSTIHRAKGLEAERIFIWCPKHMPMRWRDQLEWQLEQERNLLYVALTRSKSELYICGECDWFKPEFITDSETNNIDVERYSLRSRTLQLEEELDLIYCDEDYF